MKQERTDFLSKILIFVGVLILAAAVRLMVFWQWHVQTSQEQASRYVTALQTRIPSPQGAALEERRDNTMAVLSLDGTDFVGILEMPKFDSSLPVTANWDKMAKFPSRFSGSIYDGTMQIGCTSQDGQYSFFREISAGDALYFTDMAGNRYQYTVTDLRYEKHIDQTTLQKRDAQLTLFVKNLYGFEYLVIYCNT